MKLFSIAIISLMISACGTSLKKEAVQAPSSFIQEIQAAQKISQSNRPKAILMLNQSLSNYQENNRTDDALFLMGGLLQKENRLNEAERAYKQILSSKYATSFDGKTLIQLSKIQLKQNKENAALNTLNYIDKYSLEDQSSIEDIEKIRGSLLAKNGLYTKYIGSAQNIINHSDNIDLKKKVYKKSLSIMKIKLSPPNLKKILNTENLKTFHPVAALYLAEQYIESGNDSTGVEVLTDYSELFTSEYFQNKKTELMRRSNVIAKADKNMIGVLIPLSGKYKSVGQQILKGLQHSLEIWSINDEPGFKLAILDTNAEPEKLKLAFDEMLKTDRPIAIVGGLVGKTAEALIEKSDEHKVPTLILSQKNNIVQNSRYSFQNAHKLKTYTNLIAESASQLGFKKVAILESSKSFSKQYSASIQESFKAKSIEVSQIISYDLNERHAIPNAVRRLTQLDSKEGREQEYSLALEKWKRENKSKRMDQLRLEDLLKPKVEVDAIFIADGPKNSGLIASTLAYFDVEGIPLLGTHLWNNESLIVRGQRFVEGALFASPYYDPLVLNSNCGKAYSEMYQENLTSYSYKGLEAGLILQNAFSNDSINNRGKLLNKLQGLDLIQHPCSPQGISREDHNFSSPLIMLGVKNAKITVFDPSDYQNMQDQNPEN